MGEVTQLLDRVAKGEAGALNQVFARLHSDLKILARSRLGKSAQGTLTPTGLVNELYLKLTGADELKLQSQHHFFACAASAMRQIMVDTARAAQAGKRGGDHLRVTFDEPGIASKSSRDQDTQVLDLDRAMDELQQLDSRLRELVELKFFAGLSMDEIAGLTQRSVRSLHRDWGRARAFLHARIAA